MSQRIEVAVIPAAGRGTRMRPATRVVPKALLTVVDRPAIQYAVEEAARAGATEAVLVVDLDVGHLIQQHFLVENRLPGIEHVRIRPVVQEEALGLGHAVYEAREVVRDRPFFCLLADNIVRPGKDVLPALVDSSDEGKTSVMCLRRLSDEYLSKYGVVIPAGGEHDEPLELAGAVEKPGVERAPSRLGLIGRYLFTPEVFDILDGVKPGHGGEIQLTDAIDELGKRGRLRGSIADSDLLDVGNPLGLLEASVELGLAKFGYAFESQLRDRLGS
ncbi:MAG: sugar phosphate nucleotidyltransferase [Acidimicrobiia bacterium]|nr:sugar phosphate nucleotidyltransferase [Acidimicrobiia bacterium]MDH4306321.1 sugar phosphate nucleotidyltransferase [Acidimicrobiia bacterium]